MADDAAAQKEAADKAAKETSDKLSNYEKENTALKAKVAEFEKTKAKADETLNDKVKQGEDEKQKTIKLESALKFNLTSAEFLKTNQSILPNDIAEIFKAAEKESYDSPIQKASATKDSIINSFFKVQANIDFLTPTQKSALEDYLKLTKNGREERSQHVYENIFEPALEMIKRVKKAEEIARAKTGHGNPSDVEKAYKEKLMSGSKKHYLGEKQNA